MHPHAENLIFESGLLRVSDYCCRGTDGRVEHAAEHEIVLPRRGSYVRRNAQGTAVADANHALFFHRNDPFDIDHPYSGGDCSTIFELRASTAFELAEYYDPWAADHPDRPFTFGSVVLASAQGAQELVRLVARAAAEPSDPLEFEEAILQLLGQVMEQAFLTQERSVALGGRADSDHREAAQRVKIELRKRFSEKLTLVELAASVGYSPYHLCRVFKRQTHLSIHSYLQRLRLNESLEMLRENRERSVTAVAFELGYANSGHFTQAFRRYFRQTPSEYRAWVHRAPPG